MIIVPVERHTAQIAGSLIKNVACECCHAEWHYEMRRWATAQSDSILYMDGDGAARRAQYRARKAIHELLHDDCETAPCPSCGWLQRDMRRKRKRAMFKSLALWLGAVLLPIAFAYPFLWRKWIPAHPTAWVGFWICLAATFLACSFWIVARDLNAGIQPPRQRQV